MLATLCFAFLLPGCGDPTDPTPPPAFSLSLSAQVSDSTATSTTAINGESGTLTSLTLTQTGGSTRQLPAAPSVFVDGLEYLASYRACASGRSASGQTAQGCTDFSTPQPSDICHPKAVAPEQVLVTVEFVPGSPNQGNTVSLDTGYDCRGNKFTGSGSGAYLLDLDHDGQFSYKLIYSVRPNLPGGSKAIQLRWPLMNQGTYLGDATPENGTFRVSVNGGVPLVITRRSEIITVSSICNCIPDGRGFAFNVSAAGNVTQ